MSSWINRSRRTATMRTVAEMGAALEERVSRHDIDLDEAQDLRESWENDDRWKGIVRPYSAEDVLRFRGTARIHHTFAEMGAERLWHLLHTEEYIPALGAMSGN